MNYYRLKINNSLQLDCINADKKLDI